MKNFRNQFLLGLVCLFLAMIPTSLQALTVNATKNNNVFEDCSYIATLEDGTILGFNSFYTDENGNYYCYLRGLKTTNTEVIIPDSIVYNNTSQYIQACDIYDSNFEAPNLTKMTLPTTISAIYSSYFLLSSIEELHLQSMTPPYFKSVPSDLTIFVPQKAYDTYMEYCTGGKNGWDMTNFVTYKGRMATYSVNVSSPGQLGYLLLQKVDQWTDIDELTISGNLNDEDIAYLARLTRVRKLDLSQTNITHISNCNSLKRLLTITLPSTVTTVENNAFEDCLSLQNINLPSATTIGEGAFHRCRNLRTIDLPSITILNHYTFDECYQLKTIDIPLVTEIGYCCFRECDSLQKIEINNVKTIGGNAFAGSGLTSILIPEGCTSIEYGAFSWCKLETISIPSTINHIGDDAFTYDYSKVKDLYCYVVVPFTTMAFKDMASATLYVPKFSVTAYKLHENWYNFSKILPIEGDIDNLYINQEFAIYNYEGLKNKIDLTLGYSNNTPARLTVNANDALTLGTFVQYQNLYSRREYYDYELNRYLYNTNPYCTTLLTENKITADNISTKAYMPTGRWSFVSFAYDVNVSDIVVPEGTLWVVRKYSGKDRAAMTGNTWQNMIDNTVLKAGEGYIFHCYNENSDYGNDGYSYIEVTFPAANGSGTLFTHDDVEKTLAEYPAEYAHNRSWNLIGNPYPTYFNTQEIEFEAPITVWNGSGYTAYSLLDDEYVLSPNEAFFVQRPTTSSTIKFNKEGRMIDLGNEETGMPVRSRAKNVMATRYVYNFLLSDSAYTDRARLVVNEEANVEYEINCDANKFMSDNEDMPQLYILDSGIRYAISERPMGNGRIELGVRFGKTGEYTIALPENPNEEVMVILTDKYIGEEINLATDAYTFTAEAGTTNDRFEITLYIQQVPTNIENNGAEEELISEVYTLDGKRISNIDNLPAGVYIVKRGNEYVKYMVRK